MELEALQKLEKEIDKLFRLLVQLKEENKLINAKCQRLLNNQRKDKELIELLKKENIGLSGASINISSKKEAKLKDGLKRVLTKLDKLLLIF